LPGVARPPPLSSVQLLRMAYKEVLTMNGCVSPRDSLQLDSSCFVSFWSLPSPSAYASLPQWLNPLRSLWHGTRAAAPLQDTRFIMVWRARPTRTLLTSGNNLSRTLPDLTNPTYFIAATAYDSSNNQSDFSRNWSPIPWRPLPNRWLDNTGGVFYVAQGNKPDLQYHSNANYHIVDVQVDGQSLEH